MAEVSDQAVPNTKFYAVEPNAKGLGGHYYAYAAALARAAKARALEPHILAHADFKISPDEDSEFAIHPVMKRGYSNADVVGPNLTPGEGYGWETARALITAGAKRHDIAYVSTIGCGEFLEWLEPLVTHPSEFLKDLPLLHLMLRCSPEIARDNLLDYQKRALRAFSSVRVQSGVILHADTLPLAKAWSDILQTEVLPAPIPFDQRYLNLPRKHSKDQPIRIVYLGDARLEKGYNELATGIGEVAWDLIRLDKAAFVVQSNFNTPGGEPGIAASKQMLAHFGEAVKILEHPLESEAYANEINNADAIILPYDPIRYEERSSGIFVEAAAAGKPVITTAGSWMSTLADEASVILIDKAEEVASGIRALVEDFQTYEDRAHAVADKWRKWSDPLNFIDHLTQAADSRQVLGTRKAPSVLCVFDKSDFKTSTMVRALTNGTSVLRHAAIPFDCLLTNALGIDADVDCDLSPIATMGQERYYCTQVMDQRTLPIRNFAFQGDEMLHTNFLSISTARELSLNSYECAYVTNVEQVKLIESLGISVATIFLVHERLLCEKRAEADGKVAQIDDTNRELDAFSRLDRVLLVDTDAGWRLPKMVTMRAESLPRVAANVRLDTTVFCDVFSYSELIKKATPDAPALKQDVVQQGFDLVCVADDDAISREGLSWFIENVFDRYLAQEGLKFAVAGRICQWLQNSDLRRNDVTLLGRLSKSNALLAASRVILDPAAIGKSQNDFASTARLIGKPVISRSEFSTLNTAGSDKISKPSTNVDRNNASFADAILTLRQSKAARKAHVDAVAKGQNGEHSDAAFYRAWLGQKQTKSSPLHLSSDAEQAAATRQSARFIEWEKGITDANRLLAAWVRDEPLKETDLQATQTYAQAGGDLVLEEVWDGILKGKHEGMDSGLAAKFGALRLSGIKAKDIVAMFSGQDQSMGIFKSGKGRWELRIAAPSVGTFGILALDSNDKPVPIVCLLDGEEVARSMTGIWPAQTAWYQRTKAASLPKLIPLSLEIHATGKTTIATIRVFAASPSPVQRTMHDGSRQIISWQGNSPLILGGPASRDVVMMNVESDALGNIAPKCGRAGKETTMLQSAMLGSRSWEALLGRKPSNPFQIADTQIQVTRQGVFKGQSETWLSVLMGVSVWATTRGSLLRKVDPASWRA